MTPMISQSVIMGGTFVQGERVSWYQSDSAFKELANASAPNALYNSHARFDAPKCHPNTRLAVMEHILQWVFGQQDPNSPILWLYGPAGAGKSAIAQTMAEILSNHPSQPLLAAFFFSKSDPSRNHSRYLVPTIAYQMAVALPEARQFLERLINCDPLILTKSLSVQMDALVVEPILHLASMGLFSRDPPAPNLVILDGLDECKDTLQQEAVLRIIADAIQKHSLPLKFLIASRPEQHITFGFNAPTLSKLWTSLVLDNKLNPDSDIRIFLEDSFREIRSRHPRRDTIPPDWPGDATLGTLVKKSSGQFIYASVVQKFVSEVRQRPTNRLDVVMNLRPAHEEMPFAQLDALYEHIMSSLGNSERLILILALIILRRGRELLNVYDIERFLGLDEGDVEVTLAPLISVVSLHPEVSLTHASFGDYLLDKTRSRSFHVDPAVYNETFATLCIHHIMDATRTPLQLPQPLSAMRKQYYSFKHLTKHLADTVITPQLYNTLKTFALPDIWAHYVPNISRDFNTIRKDFIPVFINFFKDKILDDDVYLKIFQHHLSSIDPILKSELAKYYIRPALLTYVVVSCTNKLPKFTWYFQRNTEAKVLFGLNKESEDIDSDSFRLIRSRSRWDGLLSAFVFNRTRAQELFIDGPVYAQTALRILTYLCRQRKHPQNHFRGPADIWRQTGHRTSATRTRQRRVEKHQRGRLAVTKDNDDFKPCRAGLKILPELLKRSARSNKLVMFLHLHVGDIVIIRRWTRWTLHHVSEYLNRVNQGLNVET